MKVDFEQAGPAYKSYMGAAVSIIFILLSATFLYKKLTVLVQNSHIMVTSKLLEDVISQDEKFSNEQGLFVAAALTEYNNESEPIDDPLYGKLSFSRYSWDSRGGSIASSISELKSYPCTDADIGLAPDESADLQYPIYEKIEKEVETWKKKFKCIPKEDLVIWGDYNSNAAQ